MDAESTRPTKQIANRLGSQACFFIEFADCGPDGPFPSPDATSWQPVVTASALLYEQYFAVFDHDDGCSPAHGVSRELSHNDGHPDQRQIDKQPMFTIVDAETDSKVERMEIDLHCREPPAELLR
jgi:hypothetical protein